MGDLMVPISEAKGRLSEIVRESESRNVLLMRHGRPAAVVVSTSRYESLLEQLEDAEDKLSLLEHDPDEPTIGHGKLMAELGIRVD